MCCCFGSRGEHVEPVKKIPQHEFDEKKKMYASNSHRVTVPASLDHYRNRSRSSSNSGRNGYPNRPSQIGHSNGGYGSGSSRDSRDYHDRDTTHGYGHGVRPPPSLGTRALGSGLDTSRVSDYRR
ncbi:uncharacterized protein Bfra_010858 [Botrytis fragariae]|uniref:Uncharacterized protein n=1 Tax=Botrytis fragariae TaxID=1964551 RepID=A0A8H6ALQ2_9HELO|nr:uncharacterized protein Bfra_010858 [Botrytis fragariae]KAF5869661.1 hypothetical protein Bfra_010858 [Botrytis fragariae]